MAKGWSYSLLDGVFFREAIPYRVAGSGAGVRLVSCRARDGARQGPCFCRLSHRRNEKKRGSVKTSGRDTGSIITEGKKYRNWSVRVLVTPICECGQLQSLLVAV